MSRKPMMLLGVCFIAVTAVAEEQPYDSEWGLLLNYEAPVEAGESKPNILWIITDDQRSDSLACYNRATTGHAESELGYVESPNLDKLAAEGVLFTQAYCNSPACAPSRSSMHTGKYPHRCGMYGFRKAHQAADCSSRVIPEVMKEHGYPPPAARSEIRGCSTRSQAREFPKARPTRHSGVSSSWSPKGATQSRPRLGKRRAAGRAASRSHDVATSHQPTRNW